MVKKSSGNLDSARIHSRRIAQDPSVREARRDNKKPRKAMPKQGAPTPAAAPIIPTVGQKQAASQTDRLERMKNVVPQQKAPQLAANQDLVKGDRFPSLSPTINGLPPITSYPKEIQSTLKILALKNLLDTELGENE